MTSTRALKAQAADLRARTRKVSALPATLAVELRALHAVQRVLVVIDFDGVLAPIRADRLKVGPLASNAKALNRLAASWGVDVALLSGRSLSELTLLSGAPPGVLLVGSHGSEAAGADLALSHDERILHEQLAIALGSVARERPGSEVELKPVGVALHTRRCRREVALAATADAVLIATKQRGAHLLLGKEVVEVTVTHCTKGDALNRLRASLDPLTTVYLGDDKTDEHAFAVMRPSDISIKVGEGATQARFRIERPTHVAAVLSLIAESRSRAQHAWAPAAATAAGATASDVADSAEATS